MSSALDVMAFTHNLDMAGANGISLHCNAARTGAPSTLAANGIQGAGAGNSMVPGGL